nr:hypothetical protein [Tanacetum cinerariifolium]GEY37718.1 hypothetical protein [Tanacetum cinerariifolium]
MVVAKTRVVSVVWMVVMMRLVVATATVVVVMIVAFGVKGHGGVVDRDGEVVDMEMVLGYGGSSDEGGDDVDVGWWREGAVVVRKWRVMGADGWWPEIGRSGAGNEGEGGG